MSRPPKTKRPWNEANPTYTKINDTGETEYYYRDYKISADAFAVIVAVHKEMEHDWIGKGFRLAIGFALVSALLAIPTCMFMQSNRPTYPSTYSSSTYP